MAEYWNVLGLSAAPDTMKKANDAFSERYKKLRERGDQDGMEDLQRAYDVAVSVLSFSKDNPPSKRERQREELNSDDDVTLDAFVNTVQPTPTPQETEASSSSASSNLRPSNPAISNPAISTPAAPTSAPARPYTSAPSTSSYGASAQRSQYNASEYEAMGYRQQTRQVGFGEAISMFYSRYFDFSLRSSRAEYWYFTLYTFLVTIGALVVMIPLFVSYDETVDAFPVGGVLIILFLLMFYMVNAIPSLALNVRRLHDLGQSGWMYLLYIFLMMIPFIGFFASVGWLVIMCLRGTVGHNQYGADPLAVKR